MNEIGLDQVLIMSAMKVIDEIRIKVENALFESFCGGLVAAQVGYKSLEL
jgi:hypothetical protein